jgi:hypothetical protein
MDVSGQVLAASAPRGGQVTFWSVREQRYLASLELGDGCGVAASAEAGGFVCSSGYSRLLHHNALRGKTAEMGDSDAESVAWDNHLTPFVI